MASMQRFHLRSKEVRTAVSVGNLSDMSLLLRVLRIGLIILGIVSVVLGLINMALGDHEAGVPEAVGGGTLVYVLWWLPRRSGQRIGA